MTRILVFMWAFLPTIAGAGELNGVKMSDSDSVAGVNLVLNGMALRKVYKFGIPIKVYVGGLYLPQKSADSAEIVKMSGPKQIVMEFLRSVDRESLVNAWQKGLMGNCIEQDCQVYKTQLSEFNRLMVNVRKGNKMTVTFLEDQVSVVTTGPNAKAGKVMSSGFSKNLLGLFINDKQPISKEFRQQLLGMASN
ncbi:MAG: chalcone isomerase family protein [Pseudobdellovibrionaceae bacterium]|nr:chalcone isomerase family protein [Bdellovibrionales bacterium]USN48481.1 MAG: chalcone isomerase family protein [Pseudobdellovibrionaceae bacterium]